MSSTTSVNRAAYLQSECARPLAITDAPMPAAPKPDEVTICVRAVAINPVDAIMQRDPKAVAVPLSYPLILGNDIAGEVVAVGSSVTKVRPGDRVTAFSFRGGFQHFATTTQPFVTRIPDTLAYTDASVLPLCLCVAAVMLFQQDTLALQLPVPKTSTSAPPPSANAATRKVLLVWGAASSVGSCAVQLAHAAGYAVAAVAGPRNQDYCRTQLGAEYVFDHTRPDIEAEILAALRGRPFAGVASAVTGPEAIEPGARLAAALGGKEGDEKKSRVVATARPQAHAFEGAVPEGVTIGYCKSSCTFHSSRREKKKKLLLTHNQSNNQVTAPPSQTTKSAPRSWIAGCRPRWPTAASSVSRPRRSSDRGWKCVRRRLTAWRRACRRRSWWWSCDLNGRR